MANAPWVTKCNLSVLENAWLVTMRYTDEGACTVLHSSSSPLPAMMLPTAPMRGINKWKPPSLTITFPCSSGNSATTFEIFWYNANNIPFPLANNFCYCEIVLQAVFLFVFPVVCSFAFFVHSIFQLGKKILTFIVFIKGGTKTVKCRPFFCILWTFSSFFIGDPSRKKYRT